MGYNENLQKNNAELEGILNAVNELPSGGCSEECRPIKGVDYFTEEDKNELVAMVLDTLGGNPIYGYVDKDNNIVLSDNLDGGTYTVKYKNADGSYTDIGTLNVGNTIKYKTLADENSADWLNDARYNSSYVQTSAPGVDVTNYIPISDDSVMHIKGLDILSDLPSGVNYGRMYFYDGNKNFIAYHQPSAISSANSSWFTTAGYDGSVRIVRVGEIVEYYTDIRDKAKYVRFGGIPTGTVIITDNEAIE